MLHVTDDGPTAILDVDMVHRDRLLTTVSVLAKGLYLGGVSAASLL